MSRKLPSDMTEIDVKTTQTLEAGLSKGLGETLKLLDLMGVKYDERHIVSSIMMFFVSSIAVMVKPDHWENVIDGLRAPEMLAEMKEIAEHAESSAKVVEAARARGGMTVPKPERDPGQLN